MKDEEIIKGNILIAEFMGYTVYHKRYPRNHGIGAPENEYKDIIVEKAKYHSSWDWLIPVVEKIEAIYDAHHGYFGVHIHSNGCTIQGTNLHLAIDDLEGYGWVYMSDPNAIFPTKKESTWWNIVAFIRWYNHNLKS